MLRLANLSPEDMFVLLHKLRHVFAGGEPNAYLVPDEALTAFMNRCASRVGDAYFRTPRTTIKEFLNLLTVLEQNPGVNWSDLIDRVEITTETNPDLEPLEDDTEIPPPPSARSATPAGAPPPTGSTLSSSGPDDDELTNLQL